MGSEGAVDVAVDKGGFADALGAEYDDFGFEGGHDLAATVGAGKTEAGRRLFLLAARYGIVLACAARGGLVLMVGGSSHLGRMNGNGCVPWQ